MGKVIAFSGHPDIDPRIDSLVDLIEAGGLNLYVLGNTAVGRFLAFEHCRPAPDAAALSAATRAAQQLTRLLNEDASLLDRVVDHAVSVGAYYQAV